MATIQKYDGSSWVDVRYRDWKVKNGTSVVQIAPTADIDLDARVDIAANQQIRIQQGGTTIFEGYARSSGTIQRDGSARVTVDGYGITLMQETVGVDLPSPTDEDVLSAALSFAPGSGPFTLDFGPTPTTTGGYTAENRALKTIFRDMMDLGDNIWRIDTTTRTIHVESKAGRGTWASIDTSQDRASVREWEAGDVQSVTNSVTVNGTGGEESVTGTAEDGTSIDTYGEQPLTTTAGWVSTQSDADALASNLLIPDPLPEATVVVPEGAAEFGTIYDGIANYNLQLTDPSKGVEQTPLVIQKQTIREGRVTLECGAGAGIDVAAVNRSRQSADDAENIDLDEIPNGQEFEKMFATAVEDGKALLSEAVGTLDEIDDGQQYGRVNTGAIDQDGYVLLAVAEGDLDDIPDGDDYGRVLSTGISAGQVLLSAASGSLDDIEDGTNYGRVDITNLTPGGAVFATGVELDEGNTLDDVTANEGSVTVIDGGEILSNSITANEILARSIDATRLEFDTITGDEVDANTITATEVATDTLTADEIDVLDLNTEQLSITDPTTSSGIEFFENVNGGLAMEPFGGNVSIGSVFNEFALGAFGQVVPQDDNTGSVGSSVLAYSEMYAHNYITASPEPIESVDCEGLCDIDWYDNPPEPVRERAKAIGDTDDEIPEGRDHTPVELGTLSNWLVEVVKAQEERIQALESQINSE